MRSVKITRKELEAIKDLTDEMSATAGVRGSDEDDAVQARVNLVDRFLKRNGEQRNFK